MPLDTMLIVAGIVAAFTVFGLGLAYADWQTRAIRRDDASTASQGDMVDYREAA